MVFSSASRAGKEFEGFREVFTSGLGRLLGGETLGGFLLAAANARFSPHLFGNLSRRLRAPFEKWKKRPGILSDGHPLPEFNPCDVITFRRMAQAGLRALEPPSFRTVGPWELQYNMFRSFRPQRAAEDSPDSLRKEFDRDGFHFNKPFLLEECFFSGELDRVKFRLFFNKFPVVELHSLLVPDPDQELPQSLDEKYHQFACAFVDSIGPKIPGAGMGFNSYGAFASVNHLHFQLFASPREFPVQMPDWIHNGGSLPYPTVCRVFSDTKDSWKFLESLFRQQTAFNLLYLPGRVFCFPRRRQGSFRHSPWTTGFAWYEMSGGIVTSHREAFDSLDEGRVETEFRLLHP